MISNNIVGYCFPNRKNDLNSIIDVGEFFKRVLLFDKVYLKCSRLNEIAAIIERIGPEQTIYLLKSGSIKLIIDSLNVASTGQNSVLKSRKERGVLPSGSYSFSVINVCFGKKEIGEVLQNVTPKDYFIPKKILKRLKLSVVENIMESPDNIRFETVGAICSDIGNNVPSIKYLISQKIIKAYPNPDKPEPKR